MQREAASSAARGASAATLSSPGGGVLVGGAVGGNVSVGRVAREGVWLAWVAQPADGGLVGNAKEAKVRNETRGRGGEGGAVLPAAQRQLSSQLAPPSHSSEGVLGPSSPHTGAREARK